MSVPAPNPSRLTLADLDRIVLKSGSHPSVEAGGCVMEYAAYLAGEPWSDHPACVSNVIGEFLRVWNDAMNDADRQMLKPLIPLVIGTAASTDVEKRRSWMALDWFCRVSVPAWLRLAGLTAEAEAIEATAPITGAASARAARATLDVARDTARAAGDAAGDAAGATAWATARDAAWAAAWATAGDAAWDAARATARAAAGAAAGDAAGDAAGAALRPTVELLQASAVDLVRKMCAIGEGQP